MPTTVYETDTEQRLKDIDLMKVDLFKLLS